MPKFVRLIPCKWEPGPDGTYWRGPKPVLAHERCTVGRTLTEHSWHPCASAGRQRVDYYRDDDSPTGWVWGTYCCCGGCRIVSSEEQLALW